MATQSATSVLVLDLDLFRSDLQLQVHSVEQGQEEEQEVQQQPHFFSVGYLQLSMLLGLFL